jgi:hypothetical protein
LFFLVFIIPFVFAFSSSHRPVAPLCRPGQVQTYNVGRGETAQIHCEVEGIPRDINFVWKFNTSVSEVLDMPSSIVRNNGTQSTIHFKPMTEHVILAQICHVKLTRSFLRFIVVEIPFF